MQRLTWLFYWRKTMASTRDRVQVTSSAWVVVTAGPVTIGTISPETQNIRVAIETAGAPTDLNQGHPVKPKEGWGFVLDTGETLYAIADNVNTSFIATY